VTSSQILKKFWQRKYKDNLKLFRRSIRTAIKSPSLALDYLSFRRKTSNYDWSEAGLMVNQIAERANKLKDSRLVKEMAEASLRLGNQVSYTKWQVEIERINGNFRPNDWSGEDLSDATLWISFRETEKQGLSNGLNLTGYVKKASNGAKYTVLVVEKRLVDIFARTLPNVRVVASPAQAKAIQGTRLVLANSLILRSIIGVNQDTLDSLYIPLLPNKEIALELSEKYKHKNLENLPFIGIEWGTFGPRKDEAPIKFWVDLVKSINVVFVILQYKYDGYSSVVSALELAAPNRIIVDDSVNQLVDLDRFSAQLSILDAMVSTHSSDSHFAGALGVPTYLICDDLFRRSCPVQSFNKIPWYPNSVLYGKNNREWSTVFNELKKDLVEKYDKNSSHN
jgi:hypothetical protein